jgi:hypothetical protein
MAQVYAAKYLAKAAMSAPKDLIRAAVARYTPLHPTVFIFHCTFVCDARCEMCSNWTRGNRKEDMYPSRTGFRLPVSTTTRLTFRSVR